MKVLKENISSGMM